MPVCLKLILRRLLVKLATECTFKLNKRFLKQVGSCTMANHYLLLLVTYGQNGKQL